MSQWQQLTTQLHVVVVCDPSLAMMQATEPTLAPCRVLYMRANERMNEGTSRRGGGGEGERGVQQTVEHVTR